MNATTASFYDHLTPRPAHLGSIASFSGWHVKSLGLRVSGNKRRQRESAQVHANSIADALAELAQCAADGHDTNEAAMNLAACLADARRDISHVLWSGKWINAGDGDGNSWRIVVNVGNGRKAADAELIVNAMQYVVLAGALTRAHAKEVTQ